MRRALIGFLLACGLLAGATSAVAQSTASFVYPTNGASGVDLTQQFQWTSVTGATSYYLWVGTSAGTSNKVNTGETTQTGWWVCDVGAGQTLYARIWTNSSGTWTYQDISFTPTTAAPPCTATLTFPADGATNVDVTQPASWTAVPHADSYVLNLGTTQGAKDLYDSYGLTTTSHQLYDLPLGTTIYARLWTNQGYWRFKDTTFTVSVAPHRFTTLVQDATNVDLSQVPIAWGTVPNAQSYYLWVGTAPGTSNLLDSGEVPVTSMWACGVPAGQKVYLQFHWKIAGTFWHSNLSFTPSVAGPPCRATMTSPLAGATNVDPPVTFTWTSLPHRDTYYLYVGTTLGAKNLVDTGGITATSYGPVTMPSNQTIYVRMWTALDGIWRYVDSTFVTSPHVLALTPTSGFAGTPVTITGTNFGASQGSSTVTFHGVPATVTSWNSTSITAVAPNGVTKGPVVVAVSGQASNGVTFTGGNDLLRSTSHDGDRKSDIAMYRPLDGTWYILTSQSNYTAQMSIAWGASTDIPVPGDYDGDGKADVAYFHPSTGEWKILTSSSNFASAASLTFTLGVRGDVPVPGDYDGDGKTDAAVFHAGTATWTVLKSAGGTTNTVFGTWSSIPVPGDYDGDGKTDLATFDPTATPSWSIQKSSGGQSSASLGAAGDIPVPGDYDGDGKSDVAVFHPAATAQWQILKSSANNSSITIPWGTTGDVPIVGDYDGDGIIDAAVFRPSTGQWLMALSSSSYASALSVTYGSATDTPLGRATQWVQPVIASVLPGSEVIGHNVTLTGARFGPAPGTITFNGAVAQPLTWSSTAITVPVPPGATTGPVVVTANGVDSNTAAFTVLTTPGVTSTFCHTEWDTPLPTGTWWGHYWQASDCTHGVPPAGWVGIGQAQNTDNPIAAIADCQSAFGSIYNNPDFTGSTGTSLNCMYVAPPAQPQPTPGITVCSHTWNEFAVGVWTAKSWAPSDCSHGLPVGSDAWVSQPYYLPGMIDCNSNGSPIYYNPYNWGNQTTMTMKCVYIRAQVSATPRFTLCTTGTLRNPDGSINYHSGWYNPYNNYQYTWKNSDCTNGIPQQGATGIGIAVGSATNGGGGLQGGNCLPSGAQHYNDPYWSGYTTGQMRCLFENNATSPYPVSNPCGIGTFPHSIEVPADGGRWYFLMNAFAGCNWTAVATVDWLISDQAAGSGSGVLTFGISPNMTVNPRTGGIQICGTDPVVCGMFVVEQTPYWDGQPLDPGPVLPPPPPVSGPPPVGVIVYYHTDAIGSVRMVTDAGQAVLARYDYWPFGEQQTGAPSSSGTGPRMFTGAERDSSTGTGFDYLGARYYAGLFGRFMTPDSPHQDQDPADPQSWNLYTYVRNNPLRFIDPTGTKCVHSSGPNGEAITEDDGDGKRCKELDEPDVVIGKYGFVDRLQMFAQTSWGFNFTNSLIGYAVTPATSGAAIYHSAVDEGGCTRLMLGTFFDPFNPFPNTKDADFLSKDLAEQVPKAIAQLGRASALGYSLYRGLSVPMRSSIFRALAASGLARAATLAESAFPATVGLSAGNAFYQNAKAASSGACH